jgi:hypothetical protein
LTEYGIWRPYTGTEALILALALLVVGSVLAYLGVRLRQPVGTSRPGKALGTLLVLMWFLSFAAFIIAIAVYGWTLAQQVAFPKAASSPISPITFASALVAFIVIVWLSKRHGLKVALSSAIVGTIAAPMIFELPFDLIVMWRTPHPAPESLFALLFFLPLFLWELSSYSLLTLSPLARVSRYTMFSLAAVFFVFAVWALTGFSFPSSPMPFTFNVVSKVLCFVAAVTLFLPQGDGRE